MTQQAIIDNLPSHLAQFVQVQDYSRYTARDHAVWRFLLHRLVEGLRHSAHPVYIEGLEKTGISLDHIPSMEEMNEQLGKIGWSALVVDGFIPPAIFMEFQARRVLPIALDMRSVDHMLYTPAPDIVHEAAGHAPFIVDTDYAEFLQRFGEVGMKALATREDFEVYEAIRHLSIVKEAPGSTEQDIEEARLMLERRLATKGEPSEAALLSRLHWWTVEYGLVGDMDDYRIFGAGLLSSLGESVNCLDDEKVKKYPLTVDCIDTDYDITREQPQLFITRSCKHLMQVLDAFAAGMAMSRGGAESVQKAIGCRTVATAVYSSGLQVSGVFDRLLTDAVGNPIYIGTSGPTQLAYADTELPGQGIDAHPDGFGSPVGQLQDMPRCLSSYFVDELKDRGIYLGEPIRLRFVSGVTVEGLLEHIERRDHKNVLLCFTACAVTGPRGETLFEPEWGRYDMAVGEQIVSVFGGAADRERFPLYTHAPSEATAQAELADADKHLFALYRRLRELRDAGEVETARFTELHRELADYPGEWLLRYELLELVGMDDPLRSRLIEELSVLRCRSRNHERLIDTGFAALGIGNEVGPVASNF